MAITINGDGTLTGISTGGLPDGIVDTDMLATDAVTAAKIGSLPAGSILQVQSTAKTDTTSVSVASGGQSGVLSGFTVAITPSSTSSKILLIVHCNVSTETNASYIALKRGSTSIAIGDAASARQQMSSAFATDGGSSFDFSAGHTAMCFLDSPGVDTEVTYGIRLAHSSAVTRTVYLNRSHTDSDNNRTYRLASTITAIEVAA
jgi:hypothetical protein